MNEIMDTIHFTHKGRLMDAIENFSIFCETKLKNQINDRLTVKQNIIFETIYKKTPTEGYMTLATHDNRSPLSMT